LTNQERKIAYDMWVGGATWAQIADKLGYSVRTVEQDMLASMRRRPRNVNCVYPNLRRVIENEYGGIVLAFANTLGIPQSTVYGVLTGAIPPGQNLIAAVVRGTGLTEEEAFYREESP